MSTNQFQPDPLGLGMVDVTTVFTDEPEQERTRMERRAHLEINGEPLCKEYDYLIGRGYMCEYVSSLEAEKAVGELRSEWPNAEIAVALGWCPHMPPEPSDAWVYCEAEPAPCENCGAIIPYGFLIPPNEMLVRAICNKCADYARSKWLAKKIPYPIEGEHA